MSRDLRMLPHNELVAFTSNLRSLDWRKLRPRDYKLIEDFIKSDGCSNVPEFYHECCVLHDWFYRTHRNLDGSPVSRLEADKNFRECMQRQSKFGRLSPMATWRYLALRIFGTTSWED